MTREYRNFSREEKIKAVKMVLIEKKSQRYVEKIILGKKNCTRTINRWIREYIQEGEENCFKKVKGIKKVEKTEENMRYEILKKFNAFLDKKIRINSNSSKNSNKSIQSI
jgi:transposase-like protein